MDRSRYNERVDDELILNSSEEAFRKGMVRAGIEQKHLLEIASKKTYLLKRCHEDNLVGRRICSALILSDDKEKLKDFCKKEYGEEFVFDENGYTRDFMTPIGNAYFQILEIGII